MTSEQVSDDDEASPWAPIIHEALIAADVRQASYVPDAGHARLIDLLKADSSVAATVLTTPAPGRAASGRCC